MALSLAISFSLNTSLSFPHLWRPFYQALFTLSLSIILLAEDTFGFTPFQFNAPASALTQWNCMTKSPAMRWKSRWSWRWWTKSHRKCIQAKIPYRPCHPNPGLDLVVMIMRRRMTMMTMIRKLPQCVWWWWVLRYCRGGSWPPQDRKTIVYTSWCQQIMTSSYWCQWVIASSYWCQWVIFITSEQ